MVYANLYVYKTLDVLSTSDNNSEDGNLLFIVNEAPIHGHLESTDNPGKPVTLFTQLEISGF